LLRALAVSLCFAWLYDLHAARVIITDLKLKDQYTSMMYWLLLGPGCSSEREICGVIPLTGNASRYRINA
jgi:hypothetical protein